MENALYDLAEVDSIQTGIKQLHQKQQDLFRSDETKSIPFRIAQLKKLKALLKENEQKVYDAIYADFGKSAFDTYASELGLVYHELNLSIKKLKHWSRKLRVRTNLANFPARSYIMPEPLGTTLVIGAWNYPVQLSLIPIISSLAAGNTVILKPSELSSNTSGVLVEILNSNFIEEYLHVVEGDATITSFLLKLRFDKIFFTGSTRVGQIVYKAAAENMVPVTLELGGKSPVFIMADCNLKTTVKRLVWAKFLNAGQTCVAPDYILVEDAIKERFIDALKTEIRKNYPASAELSENYVRIINDSNFERLSKLIDSDQCCFGGKRDKDKRIISPSILFPVDFEDKIMQDEIFGPLLPVIPFTDLDDAISRVKSGEKPLSCYVYTQNRKTALSILQRVSFGGGAVNDSAMHFSNSHLPFGGVGMSGTGSYHGKYGFDNFSHHKSILDKPTWFEPNIKYAPYSPLKLKLIKWMLE